MHYTHRYSHGHTRISVFCPFWSESLYSPTTNTSLCTSSWIHFLTSGSSEKEMDCAAHSKLRSTAISSSNCRLSFIVTTKNWHVLFVVIPFPDVLIFSSRLWIWNRTPTVMAKGKARYVVANYIGPGTMALPSYARHTSAAYCTHHVRDGVDGWLYNKYRPKTPSRKLTAYHEDGDQRSLLCLWYSGTQQSNYATALATLKSLCSTQNSGKHHQTVAIFIILNMGVQGYVVTYCIIPVSWPSPHTLPYTTTVSCYTV